MLWNRLRRGMLTCFRFISSKLEPAGTRGRDVEAGIVIFGRSDDSVSAWSASWKVIVSNAWNDFMDEFRSHTWINGESALGFLEAGGECCTWWSQRECRVQYRKEIWIVAGWTDLYLNGRWWRRCTLEIFFFSFRLIFGYILIVEVGDMISIKINADVKRIQKVTFWGRRKICQVIWLEYCYCWRLAWRFLLLATCYLGDRWLAFSPRGHIC